MKHLLLVCSAICCLLAQNCFGKTVESLPGYHHKILFKQETGYLNGGNGRQLFYWFAGSQKDAEHSPLVLWLNGGPGCSSLEGLFTENGPWRVQADGKTLTLDPYSWNAHANVLYLESPVNVGFSYNTSNLGEAKHVHNDYTTTDTKYNALLDFFHQFPEMKSKKFYITGESYAGVYIPLLVKMILEKSPENGINLHGAAIGNGVFDIDILSQTRMDYAYNHAMVGYDRWKELKTACCKTGRDDQCDFPAIFSNFTVQPVNDNKVCAGKVAGSLFEMKSFNFDLYYVINPCNSKDMRGHITHQCYNNDYGKYLNLKEVKKAIHVSEDIIDREWEECNSQILYHDYEQIYRSMDITVRAIVEQHNFTNIIFYNGDADIVCDFLQTQRFLFDKMNYKLSEQSSVWKDDEHTVGLQYKFENGLKYYTIIGAGHYVPAHKPAQALKILNELIQAN